MRASIDDVLIVHASGSTACWLLRLTARRMEEGREGQTVQTWGEGAVAKEMGYRRAKQQRKRVKDQMKYIPVCVCASVYRIIAKLCINLQFDLLSIYYIYMHSFYVKLQFT